MKRYDCLIIGSGTAGAKIAKEFVKRDKQVAMIEKDFEVFGGSCINTACIPTKVLIEDSNQHYSYKEAFTRKNEIVKRFQASKFKSLHGEKNITLYKGKAHFITNEMVELVTKEGAENLTADHIVINTGSISKIPPIDGIAEARNVYTSTTILNKAELPKHLLIIGGGYIGLEFASMYANYGSQVTVILRDDRLLPQEDEDIAQEIQQVLEAKGIQFLYNTETEKIEETGETINLWTNQQQKIAGDALLLATGREPNTKDLQLSNTSIEVADNGAVRVNEKMQTTVRNIWAVGDVKGAEQFTYIAYDDGRQVINEIFGGVDGQFAKERKAVQFTMFVDPPLSRVGLTETEAHKAGYDIAVNKVPVRTIGRAHIIRDTRGLFKAVIDKQSGKILGVSLFGPTSEEIINIIKMAMDNEWHYTDMRDQMFNHPIMSEAFNGLFNL